MATLGRDLTAELEAIVASAAAVTLNAAGAAQIDEQVLRAEVDAVWQAIMDRAGEMVPVLARLESELRAALAAAPSELEDAARDYRFSTIKWRPDPLPMPREITGFIVLERLQSARRNCGYLLAKAHYESLRRPEDKCDCTAKVGASFLSHRPEAPLKLLDSSGGCRTRRWTTSTYARRAG